MGIMQGACHDPVHGSRGALEAPSVTLRKSPRGGCYHSNNIRTLSS